MVSKPGDRFDLTGKRFGDWTVLRNDINPTRQGRHFICQCQCGTENSIRGLDLRQGRSTKCKACARIDGSSIDKMMGKKFSKWTVIGINSTKFKSYQYKCKCECGNESIVHGPHLRNKKSTQCTECSNKIKAHNNKSHGMSRHPMYNVWCSMKQRCTNPNNDHYKNYGGRGIKVCARWNKFVNFLKDMGERPDGMTIDRIDNNGDYCPENCRWVTIQENMKNRGY